MRGAGGRLGVLLPGTAPTDDWSDLMHVRDRVLAAILAGLLAIGAAACNGDATEPDGTGASDPADVLPTDTGTVGG